MNNPKYDTPRVWTVAQAKTRLSEVLRLAEENGPQYIGKRQPFVVVPASVWHALNHPNPPMGKWLVDNMPRGVNLEISTDRESDREIPFSVNENE